MFIKQNLNKKWIEFDTHIYGLVIDSFSVDFAGFMTGWSIASTTEYYNGSTLEDLYIAFSKITSHLKDDQYIVIYTDNIDKAEGFLLSKVRDKFSDLYLFVGKHIQIRPIKPFIESIDKIKSIMHLEDANDARYIACYMQSLVDADFVQDKCFYLTQSQIIRKRLKKACNENIDYPTSAYWDLSWLFQGGLCISNFPNVTVKDKIVKADLTSAYIYTLLSKKHRSIHSRWLSVKPADWIDWLDKDGYIYYGTFRITYRTTHSAIKEFHDVNDEPLELIGANVKIKVIDVDLRNIARLCDKISIECEELHVAEADYLPSYFTNTIIDEFIKKTTINKNTSPVEYLNQKRILNSIFGDCVRNLLNDDEVKHQAKNAYNLPEWGIWCAGYVRSIIIDLGLQLDSWLYTDTDSLICIYSDNNMKVFNQYNDETYNDFKDICTKLNFDFDKLSTLGQLEIEDNITKFRANGKKQYGYTQDNKFHLVAAGFDKSRGHYNDDAFYNGKLEFPGVLKGGICRHEAEVYINDIKYYSQTSYYEYEIDVEQFLLFT